MKGKLIPIILIMMFFTACGQTSEIVSPTPAHMSTASPTQAPTQTAEPTPLPTLENAAPEIIELSDQTISDGDNFGQIKLSNHVMDSDHDASRIRWNVSGNEELRMRLVGSILLVSPPSMDWAGSESLHFEACDPEGACDAVNLNFTVVAENDAPIITVSDQVFLPNELFPAITLSEAATDEDHPAEELSWNISSDSDFEIEVSAGVAQISHPDPDWRGSEIVDFEACDPEAACSSKGVKFWVMDDTNVESSVTYVGNAGFLISAGDKKIIIDALFNGIPPGYAPPEEVTNAILNGEPPFDGLDIILATHNHEDHFSNGLVRQALENHPEAVFVSSYEAVATIPSAEDYHDRIVPINIDRGGRWAEIVHDIGLEALHISHGGGVLNLGFIITVGGQRYFHTGDISTNDVNINYFQNYGLPEKNIAVAFLPHFMLIEEDDHPLVLEGFAAKYLIPMHFAYTTPRPNYGLMETYFPDAVVFREELESWTLP
ncbi:MAG: MBL fold metallo-hydrolase [Anaerolineales bacterium]|nr:MBL fold metallo-hydrolase [Chloroflexota bacterium]MBL6979967.1 MBL fold metallo-hydrolase [Anaerolineales bacterium]